MGCIGLLAPMISLWRRYGRELTFGFGVFKSLRECYIFDLICCWLYVLTRLHFMLLLLSCECGGGDRLGMVL